MCSEVPAVAAVVFDMDGVLFDSERISRMVWIQAGKEFNVPDAEEAELCVIGRSFSDTCRFLSERYGPDFPAVEFRTRCSELFHAHVERTGMPLMPSARETLEWLRGKGYPLALASSTRRAVVERELSQAGFSRYFTTVTCGDDVAHSKPDPDIYLKACASLSLSPADCVAVEDSPNGIRSAFAAGMKCVMVPDQVQPDREIRDMLWKCVPALDALRDFL